MNVFFLRALIAARDDADHGRDGLEHGSGKISRSVVRHFKDFGLEIETSRVVLASEKAAGFVIQIAREEVTKAAVNQPENYGVAIDGVGGGVSLEIFFAEIEGLVPHARPLGRIAEKTEGGAAGHFRD